MQSRYPEYFRKSDQEKAALWSDAMFVLDANVLLNLFRYSPVTREKYFKVLEALKDRVWLPAQAVEEMLRNMYSSVQDYGSQLEQQITAGDKALTSLTEATNALQDRTADTSTLLSAIEHTKEEFRQRVDEARDNILSHEAIDGVLVRVADLFGAGQIGEPYSPDELEKKYYIEIEARYDRSQPPGYLDVKKGKPEKYGDALLWFQVLDQAKLLKQPIILVTGDKKEDWWHIDKGKTLGCRIELRREILEVADVDFHMYTPDQFLEYAEKQAGESPDPTTIQEVRAVTAAATLSGGGSLVAGGMVSLGIDPATAMGSSTGSLTSGGITQILYRRQPGDPQPLIVAASDGRLLTAQEFEDDLARIRAGVYPDFKLLADVMEPVTIESANGPQNVPMRNIVLSVHHAPSILLRFQSIDRDNALHWRQFS